MAILSETQTSSAHHTYRYDVFLSFRGADTRLSFTDHLLNALKNADLITFFDDEDIETGEDLKPELEKGIKSSRASIILLSKNYASSTWCLDELVLILEQHERNSDHVVMPIFYHVEPTDVRKQQNSFRDAMEKHKQRMEKETDAEKRSKLAQKIKLWKKALTQVADLKGKDVKGKKETGFIDEIVSDIHRRLGLPLRSTLPLLIGMDSSVESITSWLKDGSSHTVDILTVLGMGGIGKTSLTKYVYELHCREFHTSSFIENISRRCADKFHGLLDLQKQLYGDISRKSSIQVHDVSRYTTMIQSALAGKKVFLVLDDIDSLDQLDALLGNKGFHPGSKIIITTKDASLTERCELSNPEVQPKHTKHFLEGLYGNAPLELLCLHAFKCNYPKEGYEEVSKELVKYCGGHPLALEVLGRSLQNREVVYWKECIEGLKKETDSRIQKALQMSFDSLPSKNDKELFKHIACFFVGTTRHYVETILNACGINTGSGITNLIDRCLLSITRDRRLTMHQLLQEMGRDVVRGESPGKPWMQSRLWRHEESFKVLKQKMDSNNLLGLAFDMRMLEKEKLRGSFELKTDALSNMKNLMLLRLDSVQINGSFENFPEELRWLSMRWFPLKSIHVHSPMENLVVLDLSYSNMESFDMSFYSNPQQSQKLVGSCSKEKRLLGSLKILDLSFCGQLCRLSGFLELPTLESLLLMECINLTEICESIEHCVELINFDLTSCNKLGNLPTILGKLKKVQTLNLKGCVLGGIPIEMSDMDLPETHKAKNIGTKSQVSSFAFVGTIPSDINFFAYSLPVSLVILSLARNNLSNESFPMNFNCLSVLKILYLDGNPIVSLPACVRSLPKLEILSMWNCYSLTSIEHPPCTLRKLWVKFETTQGPYMSSLRKIVFDPDMSPLKLIVDIESLPLSSFEIEGVIKIQPMAGVDEKVLRSLGWGNLEFLKKRLLGTYNARMEAVGSQIQMYYEFGIFSTIYGGEEMPKCIRKRKKGTSMSFTVPSSPYNLRGLNFCHVQELPCTYNEQLRMSRLSAIRISNITKNHRTWSYLHYIGEGVCVGGKCVVMLSHWMFGMNDMEAGDRVTITLNDVYCHSIIRECGVGFVYDHGEDGKKEEEEQVLGYYKSWNHIIGGDLDVFQLTTGEYILDTMRFLNRFLIYHPFTTAKVNYKETEVFFRAFSQKKSALLGHSPTPNEVTSTDDQSLDVDETEVIDDEDFINRRLSADGTESPSKIQTCMVNAADDDSSGVDETEFVDCQDFIDGNESPAMIWMCMVNALMRLRCCPRFMVLYFWAYRWQISGLLWAALFGLLLNYGAIGL